MREKRNLCNTCWKEAECFLKERITERRACEDYDPMSMDDLDARDELIDAIFIGDCLVCSSTKTRNCENNPFIGNITIGHCEICGAYWCSECEYIFDGNKKIEACPHEELCEICMEENKYMDPAEFHDKICTDCENFDPANGNCLLDNPLKCEKEDRYRCPYRNEMSDCPAIIEYMRKYAD